MSEVFEASQSNVAKGTITEAMLNSLRGTKGWVRLIAVLLLIAAAFMVLGSFGMLVGGMLMGGEGRPGMPQGVMIIVGAMYVVMALVYIALAVYLLKYASAIDRLLDSGSTADMEAALHNQRVFWKISGVIALIMLVVMVLGIVAAIALPTMLMHR